MTAQFAIRHRHQHVSGHQLGPRLGFQYLQGGPKGVSRGVDGSCDQAIGQAHFKQHNPEGRGILQHLKGALFGQPLVFSQFIKVGRHIVEPVITLRFHEPDTVKMDIRESVVYLLPVADQDDVSESFGNNHGSGFHHPAVTTFRQHDGLLRAAGFIHNVVKKFHFPSTVCLADQAGGQHPPNPLLLGPRPEEIIAQCQRKALRTAVLSSAVSLKVRLLSPGLYQPPKMSLVWLEA